MARRGQEDGRLHMVVSKMTMSRTLSHSLALALVLLQREKCEALKDTQTKRKLWLDNEMQWRHQLAAAAVAAATHQSVIPSTNPPNTTPTTATSSHSTIQQSIANSNIPVRELMAQHEAAKRALAAVAATTTTTTVASAPSSSSSSPTGLTHAAATASPGRERSYLADRERLLLHSRPDGAREKCLNNNERERDLRFDRDGSQSKPKSLELRSLKLFVLAIKSVAIAESHGQQHQE
ncbi:hypothetical protein DMENIID0001_061510 [Sergentomyia squamirostris]